MKVLVMICSQSNAIDQRTNSLSLFNVIDQVAAPLFPVVLQSVSVCIIAQRENDEADASLKLKITLSNRNLAEGPVYIQFAEHPGARTFVEIGSLVIDSPGELRFSLMNGEHEIAHWPVEVIDLRPEVVQVQETVATDLSSASNKLE